MIKVADVVGGTWISVEVEEASIGDFGLASVLKNDTMVELDEDVGVSLDVLVVIGTRFTVLGEGGVSIESCDVTVGFSTKEADVDSVETASVREGIDVDTTEGGCVSC